MSDQSFTQTRRRFLKTAAYASALTLTGAAGLSNLALANGQAVTQPAQTVGGELVNLINHTASAVNFAGREIASGGQGAFVVAAQGGNNGSANKKDLFITDVLTDEQLAIRSDHLEFNGVFSVTDFTV